MREEISTAQQTTCSKKWRYPTRDQALLYSMQRAQMGGGYGVTRPYQCPICNQWHLTEAKRSKRERD